MNLKGELEYLKSLLNYVHVLTHWLVSFPTSFKVSSIPNHHPDDLSAIVHSTIDPSWSIHQLYSFHFPLQIREISIRHSIVTSCFRCCFGGSLLRSWRLSSLWNSHLPFGRAAPLLLDSILQTNGETQLKLECLLICIIILGLLQAFTMVCQYVSYSAILFVWCFLGVFSSCCFPFVLNPCDAVKLSIPRFQWIHSQHNLHKLFCHASCMPRSHLLLKSCDLGSDDRYRPEANTNTISVATTCSVGADWELNVSRCRSWAGAQSGNNLWYWVD